ncbi:MAG: hypothetical protein JKY11_03820, partial [Alphaproteobacteria bacterium]|nr:hypothetical protein [Alphaproteobacteria bacterium]
DHPHYEDAFLRLFPNAIILDHGQTGHIKSDMKSYPPRIFIIAEIPCFLSDAPCRFSYKVLHYAKSHNSITIIINGWLYNEKPPSRMDQLEYFLLNKYYINKIDCFLVQNDRIKNSLIDMGVPTSSLHVTGNMKYDYLNLDSQQLTPPESLQDLLPNLTSRNNKIFTAGCITQEQDMLLIVESLRALIIDEPNILFIIAPRYPEKKENINVIKSTLDKNNIPYIYRSSTNEISEGNNNVLILDTIGELKYLYSISQACYVGVNHNVLEPLIYKKPVFTSDGWEKNYPSFDVFQHMKSAGLIVEISSPQQLTMLLKKYLSGDEPPDINDKLSRLANFRGATNKSIQHLQELL